MAHPDVVNMSVESEIPLPLFAELIWGDEPSPGAAGRVSGDDLKEPVLAQVLSDAKAWLPSYPGDPDPGKPHFRDANELTRADRWQERWGELVAAGCLSRILRAPKPLADPRHDQQLSADSVFAFSGESVPDLVYSHEPTGIVYVIEAKGYSDSPDPRGHATTREHDDQPDPERRDREKIAAEHAESNDNFGRLELLVRSGFDTPKSFCEWQVQPGEAVHPGDRNKQGTSIYASELIQRMGARGEHSYRESAERASSLISNAWDADRLILLGVVGAHARPATGDVPAHRFNFLVKP